MPCPHSDTVWPYIIYAYNHTSAKNELTDIGKQQTNVSEPHVRTTP